MEKIVFDSSLSSGKIKLLNCTNGGPMWKRHANDPSNNFETYKALRIPYSRNHDSGAYMSQGGPYAHDVTCIFPNFDADENDGASYDFACTDESLLTTLEAGTKTFFRLGQTIEHQIKKHGTIPPKDFGKWARICEHIIRHYTEGWADGLKLDMPYWEIWNEPDLDKDDSKNKRTWGGTEAEFFDFFEVASKHLKSCFPDLKIGGPALAYDTKWAERFLCEMRDRGVQLDFFSWHIYAPDIQSFEARAKRIRELLDKYGYENTESILNEWNYVENWFDKFVYSVESIHGAKGAAFLMAAISMAHKAPIDMLMYYDTLPNIYNGVFDLYTNRPLKGYYPLYWYGSFYDLDHYVPASCSDPDVYTICGCGKDGKLTAVITYYADDDNSPDKEIKVDFGRSGNFEAYLLDSEHDASPVDSANGLTFTMKVDSCILIKEK